MKGLSWSPYSKELPNSYVVGPLPGKQYENMILPVLAPIPDGKEIRFGKADFQIGVNRGRGQVYPDGKLTNDNVYVAQAAGGVKSIEEKTGENGGKFYTISIEQKNGVETYEIGAGADIVVEVGDRVEKDTQLTTNPNVGGFAQDERDIILQDINRVSAGQALSISFFVAQLTFVLKKKQFEKVQMAEGF